MHKISNIAILEMSIHLFETNQIKLVKIYMRGSNNCSFERICCGKTLNIKSNEILKGCRNCMSSFGDKCLCVHGGDSRDNGEMECLSRKGLAGGDPLLDYMSSQAQTTNL